MVQAPHPSPVSLEEFLSWPEESPALELIDGGVERKPVGNLSYARAVQALIRLLQQHPATQAGEALAELGRPYGGTPRGNHRVPRRLVLPKPGDRDQRARLPRCPARPRR